MILLRNITLTAVETIEVVLPDGRDVDWFDTPEGQDWLDEQPATLSDEDLVDATPWRAKR